MQLQYAAEDECDSIGTDGGGAELIEKVVAKADHLESLLAALSMSAGSGLPDVHLLNVLWLASDLAREISSVVRLIN